MTVSVPELAIPPPSQASPSSMVSPEMVAVTLSTTKTLPVSSPLTARALAPGPSRVRLVLTVMLPLVSVMRLQDGERAKPMPSPEVAVATALRSDPGPESVQLVTSTVWAPAIWAGPTAKRAPTGRARAKASAAMRGTDLVCNRVVGQVPDERNTLAIIVSPPSMCVESEPTVLGRPSRDLWVVRPTRPVGHGSSFPKNS